MLERLIIKIKRALIGDSPIKQSRKPSHCMKRIFIGLKMPENIEALAARWASDKSDWPVRWLSPGNLHLTLAPPFYENDAKTMAGKLAEIKAWPRPLVLRFKNISYGPRPGEFRLIWAAGQPLPELEKLKMEIEKKLKLKAERRNFLPHLTLARFRPEVYGQFKVKNLSERIDWPAEIKTFALFESILRPGGAEYKIIRSF